MKMSYVDTERTFKNLEQDYLEKCPQEGTDRSKCDHAKGNKTFFLFFLCKEAKLKFRIIT